MNFCIVITSLSVFFPGNDWGCTNGKCGLGFGPTQEKFYACSDISITKKGRPLPGLTTRKISKTTKGKVHGQPNPSTTNEKERQKLSIFYSKSGSTPSPASTNIHANPTHKPIPL